MTDVVTTGEARANLHRIAQRFDAGEGEPVYFGSHRRAQAVIVPIDVWRGLLEAAEDEVDLALVAERIANDDGRRYTHAEMEAFFDEVADKE